MKSFFNPRDTRPPSPEGNPAIAWAVNRFSIVELRKLHQQLVENKAVCEANQNLVVEILRVIAEMVVYGDNKSELLFDYFCEKNMLPLKAPYAVLILASWWRKSRAVC